MIYRREFLSGKKHNLKNEKIIFLNLTLEIALKAMHSSLFIRTFRTLEQIWSSVEDFNYENCLITRLLGRSN